MIKTQKKSECGVALLFAIGILSLLLVMGLAFVSNALLSKKVAQNNTFRAEAKVLAQSAISRVAASAMLFQCLANNAAPPLWPDDFSVLFSYGKNDGTIYADQLKAMNGGSRRPSKLDVLVDGKEYLDPGNASWVFVKDANDSKLIGRFAYQVLPPNPGGNMNLDHILKGFYLETDPVWNKRVGDDINNLVLENLAIFTSGTKTAWSDWAPVLTSEAAVEDRNIAQDLDTFFSYININGTDDANVKKQNWVKRWFVEGDEAAEPESYWYEDRSLTRALHRFNIGSISGITFTDSGTPPDTSLLTDYAWYLRFWSKRKSENSETDFNTKILNSSNVVDRIANDSSVFKLGATRSPATSGAPFFRRISNSMASFDSLENRRRQIVANFNDYCDADSIPTSNVNAAEWNISEPSLWPRYTGNERTPYINEVAFGVSTKVKLAAGSEGDANKFNVKVQVEISPEMIVELVDIYRNSIGGPFTYTTKLTSLSFKVSVGGDGKIVRTGKLTGKVKEDELTFTDISKTFEVTAEDISIEFPATAIINGYYLGGKSLTAKTLDFDFSSQFNNKLINLGNISLYTLTNASIENLKMSISEVSFHFDGMMLNNGTSNVDFVRWPTEALTASSSGFYLYQNSSTTPDVQEVANFTDINNDSAKKYNRFYITGMEVCDPRQNLNPLYSSGNCPPESDWLLSPRLTAWDKTDGGSFTIDPEQEAMTDRLKNGSVNSIAVPKSPKKADNSSIAENDCDQESALDPAWLGDAANRHISTAYIRNAPMESPWELGVIHRGAKWETINLRDASLGITLKEQKGDPGWEATGTEYAGGDAGLLEQIKMTWQAYCFGKVDVNMLNGNLTLNPAYSSSDDDIGAALFQNLRYGENIFDYTGKSGSATAIPLSAARSTAAARLRSGIPGRKIVNRADLIHFNGASAAHLGNAFGIISGWNNLNDAQQEEVIGKTIDLLKCNGGNTYIQAVIVAQTIKDIDGPGIVKFQYDKTATAARNCSYGVFDMVSDSSSGIPDDEPDNVYFDEITGEVKMLVTFKRNASSGKIVVWRIEYIE